MNKWQRFGVTLVALIVICRAVPLSLLDFAAVLVGAFVFLLAGKD